MGKKKAAAKKTSSPSSNGVVTMDTERMEAAKEAESIVETTRLTLEECKARHAMARAEHRPLVARRNMAIAKSTEPKDIEDAQRHVDNAKNRETKAKSVRDVARDDWKGAEERLAKTLTESLPLFD